jgi:hypothetical protein
VNPDSGNAEMYDENLKDYNNINCNKKDEKNNLKESSTNKEDMKHNEYKMKVICMACSYNLLSGFLRCLTLTLNILNFEDNENNENENNENKSEKKNSKFYFKDNKIFAISDIECLQYGIIAIQGILDIILEASIDLSSSALTNTKNIHTFNDDDKKINKSNAHNNIDDNHNGDNNINAKENIDINNNMIKINTAFIDLNGHTSMNNAVVDLLTGTYTYLYVYMYRSTDTFICI